MTLFAKLPSWARSTLRIAMGLLCVVGALTVAVANPSCAPLPSERVDAEPSRLRGHVEALCSTREPRNVNRLDGLAEAERYLLATWKAMGLPVRTQAFVVDGRTFHNLSVLFGEEKAERVIVGAHYDVYGDLPGADDNASGVAAVLELSRLLLAKQPKLPHAVELVAWTNEEPPFFATEAMGSAAHAKALKRDAVPVKLAISVEMIGYYSDKPGSQGYPLAAMRLVYPSRGNFLAIVGQASPTAWRLVRRAKAAANAHSTIAVRSINAPAFVPGVDYSDHRSYWLEGFPAIMVTDTSFYRNANYHTEDDTPKTLDYDAMAQAVGAVYGIVVGI